MTPKIFIADDPVHCSALFSFLTKTLLELQFPTCLALNAIHFLSCVTVQPNLIKRIGQICILSANLATETFCDFLLSARRQFGKLHRRQSCEKERDCKRICFWEARCESQKRFRQLECYSLNHCIDKKICAGSGVSCPQLTVAGADFADCNGQYRWLQSAIDNE